MTFFKPTPRSSETASRPPDQEASAAELAAVDADLRAAEAEYEFRSGRSLAKTNDFADRNVVIEAPWDLPSGSTHGVVRSPTSYPPLRPEIEDILQLEPLLLAARSENDDLERRTLAAPVFGGYLTVAQASAHPLVLEWVGPPVGRIIVLLDDVNLEELDPQLVSPNAHRVWRLPLPLDSAAPLDLALLTDTGAAHILSLRR